MKVPAPYVHLCGNTQRHSSNVFRKGSITNNEGLVGKKPTRCYSIPAGIKKTADCELHRDNAVMHGRTKTTE